MQIAMRQSIDNAVAMRNPFYTPEHLIAAILVQDPVILALHDMGIDNGDLLRPLRDYTKELDCVPEGMAYNIEPSHQFQQLMMGAVNIMHSASAEYLEITHVIRAANLTTTMQHLHQCPEGPQHLCIVHWQFKPG